MRDYRRTLAWWSLGLVAFIYLHTSLYPTVRAQPELDKLVKNYPDILKAFLGGESIDFTTAVATVTFTLGCATGRRTLSIGIGAALGLAAFILNSLAILVEWLEPWR